MIHTPASRNPRQRLLFEDWPAAVYAIGDVHGCLDQLLKLERQIVADARAIAGEKWIVTLGDHIDRGPASAQVLDHVLSAPPAGFKRFTLLGNHEQMMLDFLDDPLANVYWLEQGGFETLDSYGIHITTIDRGLELSAVIAGHLPREHLALMRHMPVALSLPGWLFVHAGVRPGRALALQEDQYLIWPRIPFDDQVMIEGVTVVHGHTPVPQPFVSPHRIDIDTGCYRSGRLTGLRATPDGAVKLFEAFG